MYSVDFKEMSATTEDPPVTGILEAFVDRGHEAAFEARLRTLAEVSLRQPGHLGISTLRPAAPGEPYRVIYKYDRLSNYDRWHASEERRELYAMVSQYAARAVARRESGLESWLAFESAGTPPKWKSTIVSWFGIYPVALGWTYVMMWLGLSSLEPPIRIFILSVLVLPVTAYIVGPRIAHLMRGWLYS